MEARKQQISSKGLTFRLTAVLAGIVIACVLAEVGLRFHVALFERDQRGDLQRAAATIPPRWSGDCSGAKADILAPILRPSDEVGVFYRLKADLDTCFTGARVRTNAEGVRSEERHELPKPPGTYRVVILGDSQAFGWGVAYEEMFSTLLETSLNDEWTGRRVEVINLGVPGYNTAQEAANFRAFGQQYEADCVLILFIGNDLDPPSFVTEGRQMLGVCPSNSNDPRDLSALAV